MFLAYNNGDDLKEFCNLFQIQVFIYRMKNMSTYTKIDVSETIFPDNMSNSPDDDPLPIIHLFASGTSCGLIKIRHGSTPFLQRYKCSICSQWKPWKDGESDFKREHIKKCVQCHCGQTCIIGDLHLSTCKKENYKNLKKTIYDPSSCKIFKPKKKEKIIIPPYLLNNHHADFEAMAPTGKFTVTACGLYKATKKSIKLDSCDKNVQTTVGPHALEQFMKLIMKLKGTLWFFNGGRFDVFFILQYCIENDIPIDNEESMMTHSTITQLTIITKNGKGKLVLKDLARFLQGSLKDNCKALGIKEDASKTDFDFTKVQSWEQVEEHKNEYLEYLKMDVISQEAVFRAIASTFWDKFSVNLSDYVSLSQASYDCFSQYVSKNLLYKTPIIDEPTMRDAYRGGRIVMTKPFWFSSDYENILSNSNNPEELSKIYDSCDDFLYYVDANSLYPTVMKKKKYPCGKYIKITNPIIMDRFKDEINNQNRNPKITEKWECRLACVDVTCPKDLSIAFLMSRDENGKNIQDLKDKVKCCYTGAELIEAVRLGYKITKIHYLFQWMKHEHLFNEFIDICYKGKRESARDTPPYLMYKMVMNALSGKFGQRNIKTKALLLIGNDIDLKYRNRGNTKEIWSEEDLLLALVCDVEQEFEYSSYPIHQSSFILGEARVFMSQFTDMFDGYRNLNNIPLYGDTDSLIITNHSYQLISQEMFGEDLGQFKNEYPDCKIIGIIILGPKMYMILFLAREFKKVYNPEKNIHETKRTGPMQCWTVFKAKGIPHRSDSYLAFSDYSVTQKVYDKAIDIYHFMKERTSTRDYYLGVNVKERVYVKEDIDGNLTVKDRITWDDCKLMLSKQCIITNIYGGMDRNLKYETCSDGVGVSIDYKRRIVADNLWWSKGNRGFCDFEKDIFPVTFPNGHQGLGDNPPTWEQFLSFKDQ